MAKTPKPKKFSFALVDTENPAWALLERAEKDHEDLVDAEIGLHWMLNQKADVDGREKAIKVFAVNEWCRLRMEEDFELGLNKAWWESDKTTDEMRLFELDQALCSIRPKLNSLGDQVAYEGEELMVWRRAKPDFSGFVAPVKRRGLQNEDLKNFFDNAKMVQETIPFPRAAEG